MKYDFVEIGCSIWNTYVDSFGLNSTGLLVEPIPNLFTAVPESNTVKKENCAITSHDGFVYLYTYDEFSIDKKYRYMELNENHTQGLGWGVSSIKLNKYRKLNGKVKVKCMTLEQLFVKYNVSEIDFFKIDAEGHDHIILGQLLILMNQNKVKINKQIFFEYNKLSNKKALDVIANNICKKYFFSKEYLETDIRLKK